MGGKSPSILPKASIHQFISQCSGEEYRIISQLADHQQKTFIQNLIAHKYL
jgi:mRNA-degrading endonuclease HigB of HigAB toxin-antitoxin module